MNNLTKYALSDLYDIASGISSTKEQAGHGAPFLSFSTVFNNYFLPSELPDLMETSSKEQEIFSIKEGDVFFTRTSETVDELAMSSVAIKEYPSATFSGFLKRLRPKMDGLVYPKFMAFYFRSSYFRKLIDCNTIMTLRASFNEDIFSFLNVYLPNFSVQKEIGDFLYHLEVKTQLNSRINDNLEQQLKCIYEYEFIQNADKAWRTVLLTDIAQLYQPQTISSKDLIPNGSYYVYGANGIIGKYNLFNHKDCEIAVACRGVCGAVTMTLPNSWITGNAMVVSPKKLFPYKEFLYYTLLKKNIAYLASGSVQSQLTRENMSIYPVVLPPLDKLSKFEQLAKCFRNKMIQLSYENKKLIRMRDWLLPMLMNGQATIKA